MEGDHLRALLLANIDDLDAWRVYCDWLIDNDAAAEPPLRGWIADGATRSPCRSRSGRPPARASARPISLSARRHSRPPRRGARRRPDQSRPKSSRSSIPRQHVRLLLRRTLRFEGRVCDPHRVVDFLKRNDAVR
jgi:hypothetical protein